MAQCEEQWSLVPFNPGDFWASNGGVWTVEPPEVVTHEYRFVGSDYMVYAVTLGRSDYAAPVTNELRVNLPAGWRVNRTTGGSCIVKDNGVEKPGRWVAGAGNTFVSVFQDSPTLGWTPGSATLDVAFVAHLDVVPAV